MPRKSNINLSDLKVGVEMFKDKIVVQRKEGQAIAYPSEKVWEELSCYLGGHISKGALYLTIKSGRYNSHLWLGLNTDTGTRDSDNSVQVRDDGLSTQVFEDTSSSSEESIEYENNCKDIHFIITLSAEEWARIKPKRTLSCTKNGYVRNDDILAPFEWTMIIAEHFWEHTRLPCNIAFKRARIARHSETQYVNMVGRCKECFSQFQGIILEEPNNDARVHVECSFRGQFTKPHTDTSKRRINGHVKTRALNAMLHEKKSAYMHRLHEANRLMIWGNDEPSVLPSASALRTMKSRAVASKQRANDPCVALLKMKDSGLAIHDISLDPFMVLYWHQEQIQIYRAYAKQNSNVKICLDATGSVVKSFKKIGLIKTKRIFLYQAVVEDIKNTNMFTVSSMLSERHDTTAITNWLARWLSFDVPHPKEVCVDQSIALLAASARAFTEYSTLDKYIEVCADVIFKSTHNIPKCFLRCDVAHTIHAICQWRTFRLVSRRVKEIYVRAMGLIIQSQSIDDIRSLLLSIIIASSNETDGFSTEGATSTERHKQALISATSVGHLQNLVDVDNENEVNEEHEGLRGAQLIENNQFPKWFEAILNEAEEQREIGNGINPLYLKISLVPELKRLVKLLPLWSGIMVPAFGYGSNVASSASIEASFKVLKKNVFKDIELPTNVEVFVERHLESLKGTTMLSSFVPRGESSECTGNVRRFENATEDTTVDMLTPPANKRNMVSDTTVSAITECSDPLPASAVCPACEAGYYPSDDVHTCVICGISVHAIKECSEPAPGSEEGYGQRRVCRACDGKKALKRGSRCQENLEHQAEEQWSRKKKRTTPSYLHLNPHLQFLNLSAPHSIKTIPLLKNGSRSKDLQIINSTIYGKCILTNSCAFDSLTSMLLCAICESPQMHARFIVNNTNYIKFIIKMLTCGISTYTYICRLHILKESNAPTEEKKFPYGVTEYNASTTVTYLCQKLMAGVASATQTIQCDTCNRADPPLLVPVIQLVGAISEINTLMIEYIRPKYSPCGSFVPSTGEPCVAQQSVTNSTLCDTHFFVELVQLGDSQNDVFVHPTIALNRIPQIIEIEQKAYELRGVIEFIAPLYKSVNAIGHYVAHCKRGCHWETYDDMQNKVVHQSSKKIVAVELLLYSI